VVAIPLAWTKLNKDQLAAQILSLKALSTKLVITLAKVIVGLTGLQTSSSCTPLPQTCFESNEERQVSCEPGYDGLILEQRLTTCSTPYSDPLSSGWLQVSNTCSLKATDPTSIESPLNPASPINTSEPTSVNVTTQNVEPVPLEQNPVEQEAAMPQAEVQSEKKQESEPEPQAPKTKENEEVVPGLLLLN
jgi:hypothetical protein